MTSENNTSIARMRNLLDLYYAGTSTPQQEAELIDLFKKEDNLPKDIECDKAMILALHEAMAAEKQVPGDLESRIINATCGKADVRPNIIRRIKWRLASSAAASVAAIIALGLYLMPSSDAPILPTQESEKSPILSALNLSTDSLSINEKECPEKVATPESRPKLASAAKTRPTRTLRTHKSNYYEVTDSAQAVEILSEVFATLDEQFANGIETMQNAQNSVYEMNNAIAKLNK